MENRSKKPLSDPSLVIKPALEEANGLILNNTNESYVLIDRDLSIVTANNYSKKLFLEYFGAEVTPGMSILKFATPDRHLRLREIYEAVFQGQERSSTAEINKNGSLAYFEINYKPARDNKGNILGALVTTRDVTEKRTAEKILGEFEERWRFALEGANHGVWDWNMKTNHMFFSDSYKKLYGFENDGIECRYEEWEKRIHPEDLEMLQKAIESHSSSQDPVKESIYRIQDNYGNYRWILGRGKIVARDESGNPIRMIGIHTDITNQKREEENYKYLFYDSPVPMWTCDFDSLKFLDINHAALTLYGYSKEEFRKMTLHEIECEEGKHTFNSSWLQYGSSSKKTLFSRHKKKNGHSFYVELTTNIVERSQKKVILGLAKDITDKIHAEEALKLSNERFLLASKASTDAIYDWDITNNHLYWGEGIKTHFGYPSDINYNQWQDMIHPDDKNRIQQKLARVLKSQKNHWQEEYRFRNSQGNYRYVLEKGFILRDQSKAFRMIGSLQDISNRKYNEQLLSLERSVFELYTKSEVEFDSVVDRLLRGLEELHPDALTSVLLLSEDNKIRTLAAPRLPQEYLQVINNITLGPKDGSCGASLHQKQMVIVDDIETDPLCENCRELAATHHLRACWSLPLISSKGKTLGTFAIYYQDVKKPSEIELNTMDRMRSIMIILIEHYFSLQEVRLMNERFDNMMSATNDLIWDMNLETGAFYRSQEGLEKVYGIKRNKDIASFQQLLTRIHPADRAKVEKEFLALIESSDKRFFDLEYRFKMDNGSYSFVYDRGILIRNQDGKPIRMVGAAQNITERKRMEKEILMGELERQKAINQATIDTQEKERSEIGRELHDNVNQVLTTTKLYLELAMSNHEMKEELIQKSFKNVISVINEIRQLSRSLMDANIGDIGIIDSLKDLVTNISLTGKLRFNFAVDPNIEPYLNKTQQLTLYRIVQEALNNALRHSEASEVDLILKNNNNIIELYICDNGSGFDPDSVKKGAGLNNIENRVYLLNGTLTIQSKPGQGCKFLIKFPGT